MPEDMNHLTGKLTIRKLQALVDYAVNTGLDLDAEVSIIATHDGEISRALVFLATATTRTLYIGME